MKKIDAINAKENKTGRDQLRLEELQKEDDRVREFYLQRLYDKLGRDEELTQEEKDFLNMLEAAKLKRLNEMIDDFEGRFDSLSDQEKIKLY